MIRVNWQNEILAVRRIVLRTDSFADYRANLIPLSQRLGLELADDNSLPQPGDFWIGCHPVRGWGDADPALIGWACTVEVPVAVHALMALDPQPAQQKIVPKKARTDVTDFPHVVAFA